MCKARIGWGIWLFGAFVLCLFTETYGAFLLLALSAGLPLLLALLAGLSRKNLSFSLTVDKSIPKGRQAGCIVHAGNRGFFPYLRLEAVLEIKNRLTGERINTRCAFSVPAKGEAEAPLLLDSRYCGRVTVRAKEVRAFDWCCLFRFKVPETDGKFSGFALFLPETFAPVVELAVGSAQDLESEEYSMLRPGFDPSETFALREYMPGDKLNKIHWKLSEKLDSLMIREAGLPIQSSILILWDTLSGEGLPASPEKADACAEAVISLSQALLAQEIRNRIIWQEMGKEQLHREDIGSQEELVAALGLLLSAGYEGRGTPLEERFLAEESPEDYAHIVLVTDHLPDQLPWRLGADVRLTVLLCGGEGEEQEAGMTVFSFQPEGIERDLAYVEI